MDAINDWIEDFEREDQAEDTEMNPKGRGISWNPANINNKLDEEGRMCGKDAEGRKSKLRLFMFLQIALAIYYFVSFALAVAKSNTYYIWPVPENDPYASLGWYWIIRSDEVSFVCEGTQFYKVCEGPKYQDSAATEECPLTETYDDYEEYVYAAIREWMTAIMIYLMYMLPLLFFCFYNLYKGRYNAVLGLVRYQDVKLKVANPNVSDVEEAPRGDKNQRSYDTYARPAKFTVAFTLFCNFAKGAPSIMKSDACGRLVLFGGSLSSSTFEAFVAIIYFVCFIIMLLTTFEYAGHLCWKTCCRGRGLCCLLDCYHEACEACCSLWLVVTFCRAVFLVAAVCSLMLRIVRFDWDIDFDLNFPSWAVLSIVSLVDLVLSAIGDIYFAKWIPKLLKMIAGVLRKERDGKDQGSMSPELSRATTSSSDPNGNRRTIETTVYPNGTVERIMRTE